MKKLIALAVAAAVAIWSVKKASSKSSTDEWAAGTDKL